MILKFKSLAELMGPRSQNTLRKSTVNNFLWACLQSPTRRAKFDAVILLQQNHMLSMSPPSKRCESPSSSMDYSHHHCSIPGCTNIDTLPKSGQRHIG